MGIAQPARPAGVPRAPPAGDPGRGRFGKALVGTALGAAAVTTVADVLARRTERRAGSPRRTRPPPARARRRSSARRVARSAGWPPWPPAGWPSPPPGRRPRRPSACAEPGRPLARAPGRSPWPWPSWAGTSSTTGTTASCTTSRYMWAIHVVHHSSERYNLSTALRQPVADALGTFDPLRRRSAWSGFPPEPVATARGINLLYQFWIHTEAIDRLGRAERARLNTPSHHRVHHGINRQYLDRNHGGILIVWDRLFGTFEPEDEHGRSTGSRRTSTPSTRCASPPRVRRHGPGHRLVHRLGRATLLRVPWSGWAMDHRAPATSPLSPAG